jgi:hypothetical protein
VGVKVMTKATVKGTVSKTIPPAAAVTEEIPVSTVVSDEQLASVGVSMGFTKNLGNYESAKVQVTLTVPCHNDMASIDQTYKYAEDWVNDRLSKINGELEK